MISSIAWGFPVTNHRRVWQRHSFHIVSTTTVYFLKLTDLFDGQKLWVRKLSTARRFTNPVLDVITSHLLHSLSSLTSSLLAKLSISFPCSPPPLLRPLSASWHIRVATNDNDEYAERLNGYETRSIFVRLVVVCSIYLPGPNADRPWSCFCWRSSCCSTRREPIGEDDYCFTCPAKVNLQAWQEIVFGTWRAGRGVTFITFVYGINCWVGQDHLVQSGERKREDASSPKHPNVIHFRRT